MPSDKLIHQDKAKGRRRGDHTGPGQVPAWVLVTGASSGIGEALARRFARAGHPLVLVARSADKLAALAGSLSAEHGVKVQVQPADLAQPDAAPALARALKRRRLAIDVLVNNAGVLELGDFVAMGAEPQRRVIDLNVAGLTAMLSAFLPEMVRRGHGRVLNVASIAAFQPVPRLATYAASKAYVLSLTESLAEELAGSGVSITALCPGVTATPMMSGAARSAPKLGSLPSLMVGEADAVADDGYKACMAGEVICVPGAVNQVATLVTRATPRALLRKVAGAMARRVR